MVVGRARHAAERRLPAVTEQEAHDAAEAAGEPGYVDPTTGLFVLSVTVYTSLSTRQIPILSLTELVFDNAAASDHQ